MRRIVSYSFGTSSANRRALEGCSKSVMDEIRKWLIFKGLPVAATSNREAFTNSKGTPSILEREEVSCSKGSVWRWSMLERQTTTLFRTFLVVCVSKEELAFFAALETGQASPVVAPIPFEAHCPHVVRDILRLPFPWKVGATRVQARKVRAFDSSTAELLGDMIEDRARALPIVAVSEYDGFLLHPELDDSLAYDLAGLAIVASMNEQTSWSLTNRFGREWSCFNGAIRIYWPSSQGLVNPPAHPLWTASRLLDVSQGSTEEAARLVRRLITNRIMAAGSFSLAEPLVVEEVISAARTEQLEKLRKDSRSNEEKANEWFELATSYSSDVATLRDKLRKMTEECDRLKIDVENERLMRTHAEAEAGEDVAPEQENPPQTLQEAVEQAKQRYSGDLVFCGDVERGIRTLHPSASRPEKVLQYLGILASAARAKRSNSLGKAVNAWLIEHGATCSPESETTRADKAAQRRRTWKDADTARCYDSHLKPTDSTAPDKCVRIYFDWDEGRSKFVIGWIGRHPD
jgi:hypothetical protein